MLSHLRRMFAEVQEFLLSEGQGKVALVGRNAKGDATAAFDSLAEEFIIRYCTREIVDPVRILTEERGEVRTRPGAARWTVIVDPVDGSENFARQNELSCVSLAVLPGDTLPRPEDVTMALVGRIFGGTIYEATKGAGARRNGEPIRTSRITCLSQAILAIPLKFRGPGAAARVQPLLGAIQDARRFGTAAGELCAVAYGGVDGYADFRETLTPENYMAAYLIVREAGGVVSDGMGNPLPPIRAMTQGQTIVAAGTPELHQAILRCVVGCV